MSNRVAVKEESAFDPGDRELVTVDQQCISVLNVDGEYHAILNRCPHDCGPVGQGTVRPKLVVEDAKAGERERKQYDEETQTITCPWHGWSFELDSGNHIGIDEITVPTFDVTVEDGMVYLEP